MTIPGSAIPLLLASTAPTTYQIQRSLRFNSSDSGYCSRVFPSIATNQKLTYSFWVKRSALGTAQSVLDTNRSWVTRVEFLASNAVRIYTGDGVGAGSFDWTTAQLFRDCSTWYHIVVAWDTTQSTANNRLKAYVNGTEITSWSTQITINQNMQLGFSGATALIGSNSVSEYLSAYLAEIHLIDGQQLTPSSFAETNATTGQWVPKAYTGTYGTNGFKLNFADNSNNTATTLGKDTSGNNNDWTPFNLQTTTGGPTSVAAASGALPIYNTTDTYGATKGTGTRTDSNSSSIVLAIPMDGANNGTTFTDESATIKGSGSAKTITRNGDTKTSTAQSKFYGSSGFFDGTGDYLRIAAGTDFSYGTGDFTFECWIYTTASGVDQIIFGQTSSGNNFVNIALTTTNLLSVQINSSGSGNNITSSGAISANRWHHIACTRSSSTVRLFINGVLDGSGTRNVDLSLASIEPSIGTYSHASTLNFTGYINDFRIYKGVAKYTSNFLPPNNPQSAALIGAGNDSLVDTPTSYGTDDSLGGSVRGNYCTWNALDNGGVTLSNGNLDTVTSATWKAVRGAIGVTSGKWYWEYTMTAAGYTMLGMTGASAALNTYAGVSSTGYAFYSLGGSTSKWNNNTSASYGNSFTTNDVIGVAFDADNGKIWFAKNGSWQASGDPAAGTNAAYSSIPVGTYFPTVSQDNSAGSTGGSTNFGQRPFAYTAPSGFKALCDTNLPAPVVAKPNTVMDVKLYTGNGSNRSITGFYFSPDLVWIKDRTLVNSHMLFDAVRGANKSISSDATSAENTARTDRLTAFNSDGFDLGVDAQEGVNKLNSAHVAWCWDAGSSNTTNTQGSITSQVRTNGYLSIVTYASPASGTFTIGHGLNVEPSLVITRARNAVSSWSVFHRSVCDTTSKYLVLNRTDALLTFSTVWGAALPSSTVIGLTVNGAVNASSDCIAYCFAPVAGYSSGFSYTGNGSTDGVFQFLGFRPRLILLKRTDTTGNWTLIDTAREGYNVDNDPLYPNLSDAEGTADLLDITSNGFKLRSTDASVNANAGTYVGFAWAEAPFAYSRAR